MSRNKTVFRAIDGLQQVAHLFNKRRAQLARRVDLTEAQWRVLEGVATEHFMPSLFADNLDSTRGAVSKTLKQLLEKSLVRAAISGSDGRQRNYALTPKGKQTLQTLRKLRENAIREVWSDLPLADLETFNRLCEQLTQNLRA